MDPRKAAELKVFIEQCEANPAILHDPSLRFFKNYLEKLGAKVPSAHGKPSATKVDFDDESDDDVMPDVEERCCGSKATCDDDEASEEEVESEIELDNEGVVTPDEDAPQKMGDSSIEITDDMRDNAQLAKAKAMDALAEGNLDEAITHLTEAILCNPSSSILYANRAGVYVKMKKPNAAIRDADAAIKINPDSAKSYKWRGQAYALLGEWKKASQDLCIAAKLDYDEETNSFLKKVEPNVLKIDEHHKKYERLRKERAEKKAERERQRRRREAQAAYEKAKESSSSGRSGGFPGGFPGGMPGGFGGGMPGMGGGMPAGMGGGMPAGMGGGMPAGMGGGMPAGMGGGMPGMPGMPGGGGMPGGIDMSKILSDPELLAAFKDPEVMAALQDVMKNPANISKHQGNPKVAPIIAKMMSKFAGSPP